MALPPRLISSARKGPAPVAPAPLHRPTMMKQGPLSELQKRIGYSFRNSDLLREALTHSSFIKETSAPGRDNELLEFLGDAVLNFLVTVRLVETFPTADEGELSRIRAGMVAATHLARVARALDLGSYLQLGASEERTGGREKTGLAVNAVEALIAAQFLDGGREAASNFVERFVVPGDLSAARAEFAASNYKGALQEFLQARRLGLAQYRVTAETGAEHQRVFTVAVRVGSRVLSRGSGASKKAAEQEAAQAALHFLRNKYHA